VTHAVRDNRIAGLATRQASDNPAPPRGAGWRSATCAETETGTEEGYNETGSNSRSWRYC